MPLRTDRSNTNDSDVSKQAAYFQTKRDMDDTNSKRSSVSSLALHTHTQKEKSSLCRAQTAQSSLWLAWAAEYYRQEHHHQSILKQPQSFGEAVLTF